ncbi:MAG: hypothetical protein ACKOEZ_03865 [Spartobacteria bacterium]
MSKVEMHIRSKPHAESFREFIITRKGALEIAGRGHLSACGNEQDSANE